MAERERESGVHVIMPVDRVARRLLRFRPVDGRCRAGETDASRFRLAASPALKGAGPVFCWVADVAGLGGCWNWPGRSPMAIWDSAWRILQFYPASGYSTLVDFLPNYTTIFLPGYYQNLPPIWTGHL